MATRALMTAAEFGLLDVPETERYELVEGELIPLSSATPRHNKLRTRIESMIDAFLIQNLIGETFSETDCRITDITVRCPDVAVFIGDRARALDQDKIPVPYAPDIAVEIISRSENVMNLNRKILDYLNAGTQEVWVIDPQNRELFIHAKTGIQLLMEDQILESPLLPGFAVTLRDLLL